MRAPRLHGRHLLTWRTETPDTAPDGSRALAVRGWHAVLHGNRVTDTVELSVAPSAVCLLGDTVVMIDEAPSLTAWLGVLDRPRCSAPTGW